LIFYYCCIVEAIQTRCHCILHSMLVDVRSMLVDVHFTLTHAGCMCVDMCRGEAYLSHNQFEYKPHHSSHFPPCTALSLNPRRVLLHATLRSCKSVCTITDLCTHCTARQEPISDSEEKFCAHAQVAGARQVRDRRVAEAPSTILGIHADPIVGKLLELVALHCLGIVDYPLVHVRVEIRVICGVLDLWNVGRGIFVLLQ